ncbi:hypothetical protein Q4F19_17800 [Sphingomonas sp. BIUV-7]|uniref:Uncharacterized protein n=1 Tax=Sphingomonas natans TaxID=3063330 RepID=A0ABT8YD42_9SPHN|nr:hypothetical protein [Sphingomonas sp. BIUV-7]MDO6416245.1 hypothetical protein [Sphingomonas sp. BIUV-7]
MTASRKLRRTFSVEAGGRQHAALQALAREGKLAYRRTSKCQRRDGRSANALGHPAAMRFGGGEIVKVVVPGK